MQQGLAVAALLAAIAAFFIVRYALAAKRRKALAAWAQSEGLAFDPGRVTGLAEEMPAFQCLRRAANFYAYNVTRGELGGRALLAFDCHYETYSTDSKGRRHTNHHYFSAAVARSSVPLKPLLIRPEGFLDKLTEFLGFEDIDFESAEFSRRFYVTSPDKRWAYDVVHQRTMEFLLSMPRFTIQLADTHAMAYKNTVFAVAEFESAVNVAAGILNLLPEYVIRQQTEGANG